MARSPRFVGRLEFERVHCAGEFRPGAGGGLVLRDLRGRGTLRAVLHAGPFRLPLTAEFSLEGAGRFLAIRPRRGGHVFRLLRPFLGGAWRSVGADLLFDPAAATCGRVRWSPGDPGTSR
ncbi:MAG: hypothetical protein ACM3XS_04760 [Bacteroidota bacterium]